MVEGTPTTGKPSRARLADPDCEPLPPITARASIALPRRLASALARPAGSVNSGQRALPSTVPPDWMMPPTLRACTGSSAFSSRSEEHTSELQSPDHLVCRLLLEIKK